MTGVWFLFVWFLTEIHATVRKEAGSNLPVKREEVLRGSLVSGSVSCGAAVTCDLLTLSSHQSEGGSDLGERSCPMVRESLLG